MITEQELNETITQYEGMENPTTQTCITLASLYIVRDKMFPQEYSYEAGYSSDTEFGQALQGKATNSVLGIMDELMSAIQVLSPSLYYSVIDKVSDA